MKDLVIFGAGGWAREVYGIVSAINADKSSYRFLGFLDSKLELKNTTMLGQPVLGDETWLEGRKDISVIVGIGNTLARKRIAELLETNYQVTFPTLIHPQAYIGPEVSIGEGSVLHVKSVATVNLKLGRHAILNVSSVISHENNIADYVSIHPNSSISGAVTIEEGVELGTCCSVIHDITIGRWSVVGAGSTVIRNIEPFTVNVGVPTRAVKVLSGHDLYPRAEVLPRQVNEPS
ncbi:MAG: acetyltransferase [Trueperaceae bacterium]|nr:acetyltransferase [Trueperaceae bacterium]